MSLFSNICEGIITEINANQAYERFYSTMPREDYDTVVGGETNIDKFIQFFLNAVRDDNYPVGRAKAVLDLYRSADPLIRQNIKNSFNAGEYDTPDEIAIDVDYLKNGGVVNKNKFAKEGFIVLAKDENWTITCTTNYLANTHYFGYTSWCTASDRAGRYDGYNMFKRYTDSGDELLIQATSNANKEETYQMEIQRPQRTLAEFDDPDNGFFAQVCDKKDNGMYGKDVLKRVGKVLEDVLNDKEKLLFCLKKQKEQYEPEQKYQEKQDKIIDIKRVRREKAIAEKRKKLEAEVTAKNAAETYDTAPYWKEIVDKKLYEDPEFLTKVHAVTRKIGDMDNPEEELELMKSVNFLIKVDSSTVCRLPQDNLRVFRFNLGLLDPPQYRVVNFYGDYGLKDCKIEFGLNYSRRIVMAIVAIYDADESKYTKVLLHLDNEGDNDAESLMCDSIEAGMGARDMAGKYILALGVGGYDCIMNTETGQLYKYSEHDGNSRQNRPVWVLNYFGHPFFVSRSMSDGTPFTCILVKSPEDIEVSHESDRYLVESSASVLLDRETGHLMVSYQFDTVYSTKIPTEIAANVKDCWKSEIQGYLYVILRGGKENVFCVGTENNNNQFVFGDDCTECDIYESRRTIIGRIKKGGVPCYIKYSIDSNSYILKNARTGEEMGACDKYGYTEKEKLGDYNMKKYWKGYSPETQAQMDQMWGDREQSAKQYDGSKALAAWDDNDRKRFPEDSYYIGQGSARELGKGEEWGKDGWGGRVGLKDPAQWWARHPRTTSNTDFDRDFYKIGNNGKPIGQTWRDEDEVPANFAEYPEEPAEVNEAVKKIKSLLDRMNLND